MQDMTKQVEYILNNYSSMKNEIQVVKFELDRIGCNLSAEVIEGAVLTRSGYEMVSSSHVSDKTSDIVVEHIDSQRGSKYYALTVLIHNLRFELHRLEYYLTLLPEKQSAVVKLFHFDRLSWTEIAELTGCSQSTLQRRKRSGVDRLEHYYSVLYNFNPDGMEIPTSVRFIGYIHEERFAHCLTLAKENRDTGIKALLYIISGCNEIWMKGVEAFLDVFTGEIKSYAKNINTLSDNSAKLLRLAYHLAHGVDRDNLLSVLNRYFSGLEHVHLELAIEAVKLVLFSYEHVENLTRK